MNSDAYSGICVWLFETGSTRCSACDSRYNEWAQVSEPLTLRVLVVASEVLATVRKLELRITS